MIRIITTITLLNLFAILSCAGQMKKEPAKINNAVLLTRTEKSTSALSSQTHSSKILYTSSLSGDEYFAYISTSGTISDAIGYRFATTRKGLFFVVESLFSSQYEVDSLRIFFNDAEHMVRIGITDEYILYPSSYKTFKEEVDAKHKILSLISLLEDNIGDYPITALLPLVMSSGQKKINLKIKNAQISTLRSQAEDFWDRW